MEFAVAGLVADIAVEAPHVRLGEIAEAVVVQAFERAVDGVVLLDLLAPLRRALDAAERAAHEVELGALIGEAILHLQVDRATQRIEAEGGIVGHQRHRPDRGGGDQVPVHGIRERFVDADTVLVDREALRRARHGRSDKAAELNIRRERIAGDFADVDAGDVVPSARR